MATAALGRLVEWSCLVCLVAVSSACKEDAAASKKSSTSSKSSGGDSCAKEDACKNEGRCTSKGGACVVGGDADCAKNDVCSDFGRCVAYEKGSEKKCGAISDEKCAAGSMNQQANRVFARAGGDAPLTTPCTEDLAHSVGCFCVTEAGAFR